MNPSTPLAQTFIVDSTLHPYGVFIAAIDLCFQSADDSLPITLQLRPTINGYPDVNNIYNGGIAQLSAWTIANNTTTGEGTDIPDFNNPETFTRFTFPTLVYLPAGEHAIVLQTASLNYFLWMGQLQEPQLGSTNVISGQPYVGSFFASQNGGVWTPYQNQDLVFRVVKAKFDVTDPSVVQFKTKAVTNAANLYMDVFNVVTNDQELSPTLTTYAFEGLDINNNRDASPLAIETNTDQIPNTRRVITAANGDMTIFSTMTSTSEDVSPILDPTRLNVIGITNIINNGELSNSLIQIVSPGAGLANGLISFNIDAPTGPNGTQASLAANVVNGSIANVWFSANGSFYVETPNVTYSGANTVLPSIIINGETSASGGNALFRYFTQPITLADGFDATDIQVYFNGCWQSGVDVEVYYKIMSAADPDQNFSHKNWVRMYQNSNIGVYSQNWSNFIQYQYVTKGNLTPGAYSGLTYVSNGSLYKNFKTFSVKVCGFSSSTTIVPIISGFRAIALA